MQLITCNIPPKLMAGFVDSNLPLAYDVTDDSVEIWMHGVVGDEMSETDSQSVGQLLAKNKGKSVTLRVNSPGGLAYDGVAIFNALQSHDGPTTGLIEGMAGSAASLAVVGCDRVKCYEGAVFHPHYSLVLAFGHQPEIREALAIQERLDLDLEQMYKGVSNQTLAKVRQDLEGPNGDGTTFSAQEAVNAGYVHEVVSHGTPAPAGAEAEALDRNRRSLLAARTRQHGLTLTARQPQ